MSVIRVGLVGKVDPINFIKTLLKQNGVTYENGNYVYTIDGHKYIIEEYNDQHVYNFVLAFSRGVQDYNTEQQINNHFVYFIEHYGSFCADPPYFDINIFDIDHITKMFIRISADKKETKTEENWKEKYLDLKKKLDEIKSQIE